MLKSWVPGKNRYKSDDKKNINWFSKNYWTWELEQPKDQGMIHFPVPEAEKIPGFLQSDQSIIPGLLESFNITKENRKW